MKNKLFLLLFTFSLIINAQKDKGTVTLNNGNIVSGLVKIKSDKIVFKTNKAADAEKYDFTQAKSATITDKKGEKTTFEFVVIKEGKDPELLELIVDGYLKLYGEGTSTYSGMSAGMSGYGGSFRSTSTHYLKKESEAIAQFYKCEGYVAKISFTKFVEEYFSDCPKIQSKVKDKEFKKKDYKEIVEYYNSHCASKE